MNKISVAHPRPIYEELVRIADANPELLTSNRVDLTVSDKRVCERIKGGDSFIWVLHQCGTLVFPLNGSTEPLWLTCYGEAWTEDYKAKFYLVTVTGPGIGKVEEIGRTRAFDLAERHGKVGRISATCG